MNVLNGKWPGVVESYDAGSRECRVSIPGITDGSDIFPLAAFCNPLGDRPGDTEIRILAGDLVWLEFEQGDPRFPIIAGYRTPRAGNPVGWRRWHHANIELTAEHTFLITLGSTTVTVTDGQVHIDGADTFLSGDLHVAKGITATLAISAGTSVHAGTDVSAGANVVAALNIADQGGAKTMAAMRETFNSHAGHYYDSNRPPDAHM